MSVTSGPLYGRHTVSVRVEQILKNTTRLPKGAAQVQLNSAPNASYTGVSSVLAQEERILNERNTSSKGILRETQAQIIEVGAKNAAAVSSNEENMGQVPEDYFVHQECISLTDIKAAMADVETRLPLYCTMLTSKLDGWPVHKLSQFPAYVQSLRTEFLLGERVQAAVDAAKDFELPHEFLTRDIDELQNKYNGDFASLVRARRRERGDERFNSKRCMAAFWDDQEYVRLTNIATLGAQVEVPVGFSKQYTPEDPRKKQVVLQRCYNKHATKLWLEGKVLAMPLDQLSVEQQQQLHLNPPHWTPKVDSVDGRFLIDCSNRKEGVSLNNEKMKELAAAQYGHLEHPTIV